MAAMLSDITQERLKELLHYDPETGVFTWLVRLSNRGLVGSHAGSLVAGYIDIGISSKSYRAHRLAWLYVNGEWPEDALDHINGDTADNRIKNLRETNKSENGQNVCEARINNQSGFLGVSPKRGKWRATIMVDGKQTHLGSFDTPELAADAYWRAKPSHHPATAQY